MAEESYVDDVTPDSHDVIYTGASPTAGVRTVSLEGPAPGKVLLREPGAESGDRTHVSAASGRAARWARDGRELYFVSRSRLMAATFGPGAPPPSIGSPVEVATVPDMRGYDVLPGHRQFVALQRPPDAGYVRRLRLALNWMPESRPLTNAAGKLER